MTHREADRIRHVSIGVLTVSDTRTEADDLAGRTARDAIARAGHRVHDARIVPDDPDRIARVVDDWLGDPRCDAIVVTGGTGLSPRDRTPEALAGIVEREIPGFGDLFRMLSWREVGAAAMLSRVVAGIARSKPVFALPGSPKAVALGVEDLILPILGHLLAEIRREA